MTTYVLLELGDDGQVKVYDHPGCLAAPCRRIMPVSTGWDRGQFSTFEIGRFSVDVAVLPERKERE